MENILNFDDIFEEAFNFEEEKYGNRSESFIESFESEETARSFVEEVEGMCWGYTDYIEESKSNESSFLLKLVASIKDFFSELFKRFKNFITKNGYKEKLEEAKQVVASNKGIGRKRVKSVNYEELNSLQKKTIDALDKCKSASEIDKVMEKYQNSKKAITGSAIAVTVASILTAATLIIRHREKGNNDDSSKIGEKIKKFYSKFRSRKGDEEGLIEYRDNLTRKYARAVENVYNDQDKYMRQQVTKAVSFAALDGKISAGVNPPESKGKYNTSTKDFVDRANKIRKEVENI